MNYQEIIANIQNEIVQKDKYIELLEKVNQQISYTWNPYLTILTIILVIIALGTIVSMFIIYSMGKDFRKNAALLINEELKDRNNKIINWEKQANAVIAKYKKELENIQKTKEVKKEYYEELIEKLQQLENEKDRITVSSGIGMSNFNSCKNCGAILHGPTLDGICDSCKNWGGSPPGINID